jgi:putative phosphoribosyl transferase
MGSVREAEGSVRFRDRRDAGRCLARRLAGMELEAPVVLALPRGGVAVAYEVARALCAPMTVFLARKVGAPGHEELGIGAVAEGDGGLVVSEDAAALGVDAARMAPLVSRERAELDRRIERYRGGAALPPLEGRDVVLVDDGLATGVTAEAALRALRKHQPRRIILAVPVCAPQTRDRLGDLADAVVCAVSPSPFVAVGLWYEDFRQATDDEVVSLLEQFRSERVTA